LDRGTKPGIATGLKGVIKVDRRMRTNLQDIDAAGDCVETRHKILQAELISG